MTIAFRTFLFACLLFSCGALVSCEEDTIDPNITPTNPNSTGTSGDTSTQPVNPNNTDPTQPGDTDTTPPQVDICQGCAGFDGVDILVVVDNSSSMAEEQDVLASGFFTLINSLVVPTADWTQPAARDVRVGIVSSDLGMQYGTNGEANASEGQLITGCGDNAYGDDGQLMSATPASVSVDSYSIKCDPDGAQCPDATWTCTNGFCEAPGGVAEAQVACQAINTPWADYTVTNQTTLAKNVACMAQLGTDGCGIEQQLQAGVRALQRPDQSAFARANHLLAVMVVSDEEDCSMKTNGLFPLPEFDVSNQNINVVCNYPPQNETNNLFDAAYFRNSLVAIKGGNASAVVFAAIVGVPAGDGSPCQGTGDAIGNCLAAPAMQYNPTELHGVTDDGTAYTYTHFAPACERVDPTTGTAVTSARPGRRYVKVAQEFGCASYVYSICNEDWSGAMVEIARLIASCLVV